MSKMPDSSPTKAANGAVLPPLSPKHLDHPESWATGGEEATQKQKGFVKSLESQHDITEDEKVDTTHLSKTDASIAIDHLKKGEPGNVEPAGAETEAAEEKQNEERQDEERQDKEAEEDNDGKKTNSEEQSTPKKSSHAGDASDPIQVDSEPSSPSAPSKRKHTSSPQAKRTRADAIKSAKETENQEPEPKKARTDGDDDLVEGVKAHDGTELPPLSPNHLDKPDQWATGGDPATGKQKAFIRSLEQQKGEEHVEVQGKSEASERIDELKNQ